MVERSQRGKGQRSIIGSTGAIAHDRRTLDDPSRLLVCQCTYGEIQAVEQKECAAVKGSTEAIARYWLKQAILIFRVSY